MVNVFFFFFFFEKFARDNLVLRRNISLVSFATHSQYPGHARLISDCKDSKKLKKYSNEVK